MSIAIPDPIPSSPLAQALDWLQTIGAAADVPLIVDSGTLLGLVREGRTLTNDPEIDVSTTAPDAVRKLLAVLGPDRAKMWRFGKQPYRIEIKPFSGGPPLPTEIKFFRQRDEDYVCPAIGWRSPGGGNLKTRGAGMRDVLRPAWRALMARGDAARFPMRHFARTDEWVVPAYYFNDTLPIGGRPHCRMPAEIENYLSMRYHAWKQPASSWVTWRDDGAYHANDPAVRLAQGQSPHRGRA